MAKLILGEKPDIQVKSFKHTLSAEFIARVDPVKLEAVLDQAYRETATLQPGIPTQRVPALFRQVRPIHACVPVEVFVPGCPPSADTIFYILSELIAGRTPDPSAVTRFGA